MSMVYVSINNKISHDNSIIKPYNPYLPIWFVLRKEYFKFNSSRLFRFFQDSLLIALFAHFLLSEKLLSSNKYRLSSMNVRSRIEIRVRLRTVSLVPPFTVASPNKRPPQSLTCLLKNLITFIYCILLFMCLHLVCFLNLFLVSDFVVFRKYFDSS